MRKAIVLLIVCTVILSFGVALHGADVQEEFKEVWQNPKFDKIIKMTNDTFLVTPSNDQYILLMFRIVNGRIVFLDSITAFYVPHQKIHINHIVPVKNQKK